MKFVILGIQNHAEEYLKIMKMYGAIIRKNIYAPFLIVEVATFLIFLIRSSSINGFLNLRIAIATINI